MKIVKVFTTIYLSKITMNFYPTSSSRKHFLDNIHLYIIRKW